MFNQIPQFTETGAALFPFFWLTNSIPFAKVTHNGDCYEIHFIEGARLVVLHDLIIGMKAADGGITILKVYAKFNTGDFLETLVNRL